MNARRIVDRFVQFESMEMETLAMNLESVNSKSMCTGSNGKGSRTMHSTSIVDHSYEEVPMFIHCRVTLHHSTNVMGIVNSKKQQF